MFAMEMGQQGGDAEAEGNIQRTALCVRMPFQQRGCCQSWSNVAVCDANEHDAHPAIRGEGGCRQGDDHREVHQRPQRDGDLARTC